MMLVRSVQQMLGGVLKGRSFISHIKNMNEENCRVQAAEMINESNVLTNDRVYKPTYPIEFNREGEVLIYSGTPIKDSSVYFKYPYIFYESFVPMAMINYALNPFDLVWHWNSFFLYFTPFVYSARIWYWRDFAYHPNRLFLLRGGRVLKVESQTLGNARHIYWVENQLIRPLTADRMRFDDQDQADFLDEEGQLKYNLSVEAEEFKVWGVNMNDEQLHFKGTGKVHHPELFEAAMKGYNIDTTDFTINTSDNVRFREANYDQ